LGVKRTWHGLVTMSANDPKRTYDRLAPAPGRRARYLAHLRHTAAMACLVQPPKRKFETFSESFTEGSKNVDHLLRYLSIQRDPEFFSAYHHQDHVRRQLSPRRHQSSNC